MWVWQMANDVSNPTPASTMTTSTARELADVHRNTQTALYSDRWRPVWWINHDRPNYQRPVV